MRSKKRSSKLRMRGFDKELRVVLRSLGSYKEWFRVCQTVRPDQNASGNSILCPNKKDRCPDDKKCCLRYDTVTYFCCPYGDGVCCSDGTFCCKPGFRCFVPTQSCIPLDSNVGLERVHFEADQRLHEPQRITNTTTRKSPMAADVTSLEKKRTSVSVSNPWRHRLWFLSSSLFVRLSSSLF